MSATWEYGDAELVSQSQAGNRDAFGLIVGRYQSLICSLAYSATGNLSQSEDLAQETFLTAWKRLHDLREPHRLRSWLCGIARNLISNTFRKQTREPVYGAKPLEVAQDAPSPELLPSEQAISQEEESILWRSLERVPSLYREPLILFYREHQSVERVAEALELSQDAVKQRLARGRKMLHEQVTAFVEGALQRTTPGKAFTLGVLAALPVFAASSATAATLGTTAAKASPAAKAAATAGLVGAILGPIIGLLGGVYGAWVSIKNTRSPRERQFMIRQTYLSGAYVLLFLAALFALIFFGRPLAASSPVAFGCTLGLLVAGYGAGLIILITKSNRRQQQIRIEDGTAETLKLLQPQFPNRRQQIWNVYGSLGGGTAGTLAWMVIQAAQARDWITATVTVLFGAVIVLVGGRAWMRRPERRFRVIVQTLAVLGLFTLIMGVLHWRDWTNVAGGRTTAGQAVLLGSGLAAISAIIGGFTWFRHHRLR